MVEGKVFLGGLDLNSSRESVSEYCQQWWVAGAGAARERPHACAWARSAHVCMCSMLVLQLLLWQHGGA